MASASGSGSGHYGRPPPGPPNPGKPRPGPGKPPPPPPNLGGQPISSGESFPSLFLSIIESSGGDGNRKPRPPRSGRRCSPCPSSCAPSPRGVRLSGDCDRTCGATSKKIPTPSSTANPIVVRRMSVSPWSVVNAGIHFQARAQLITTVDLTTSHHPPATSSSRRPD